MSCRIESQRELRGRVGRRAGPEVGRSVGRWPCLFNATLPFLNEGPHRFIGLKIWREESRAVIINFGMLVMNVWYGLASSNVTGPSSPHSLCIAAFPNPMLALSLLLCPRSILCFGSRLCPAFKIRLVPAAQKCPFRPEALNR